MCISLPSQLADAAPFQPKLQRRSAANICMPYDDPHAGCSSVVETLLPHLELLHSMAHSGGTSAAAPAQQLLLLDIIGCLLELSPSRVLAARQPSFVWLLGVYTSMLRWGALQTSVSWGVLHLCLCLQDAEQVAGTIHISPGGSILPSPVWHPNLRTPHQRNGWALQLCAPCAAPGASLQVMQDSAVVMQHLAIVVYMLHHLVRCVPEECLSAS